MGGVGDQGSGVRDKLGGNSTYLVVRQIEQATYAVIQFTSGVFDLAQDRREISRLFGQIADPIAPARPA